MIIAEHLDPINVKIAELREALESVTAEQKYLKARDTRHRHSKFCSFNDHECINGNQACHTMSLLSSIKSTNAFEIMS